MLNAGKVQMCASVASPVACGAGSSSSSISSCARTGVNGVALVSAIFGAENIEAECRELKALAEQL